MIALPFSASLIILFQDLFKIRGFVKDFTGELRVGDDPPIAVILQGAGADVKPSANLLAREKVFTAEERPVSLGHFSNPFSYSLQGGEDHLHLACL